MAAATHSQTDLKEEKKALRKDMRKILQALDLQDMQQQSVLPAGAHQLLWLPERVQHCFWLKQS